MNIHPEVLLARRLAGEIHAQDLYGDRPYMEHLEAADQILESHRVTDRHVRAAVWLHDVLEDHGHRWPARLLIARGISPETIDIVQRVTDEPGANRNERKAKTYPKIADSPKAVVVKLADRIANVQACRSGAIYHVNRKAHLYHMYCKEQPGFEAGLGRGQHGRLADSLWATLDAALTLPEQTLDEPSISP